MSKQRENGLVQVITLAVITFITVSSVGTAIVADKAIPGDPLYKVDTAVENLRTKLANNAEKRARLHAIFSNERVEEMKLLSASENPSVAQLALLREEIEHHEDEAYKTLELEKVIGSDVTGLEEELEEIFSQQQNEADSALDTVIAKYKNREHEKIELLKEENENEKAELKEKLEIKLSQLENIKEKYKNDKIETIEKTERMKEDMLDNLEKDTLELENELEEIEKIINEQKP